MSAQKLLFITGVVLMAVPAVAQNRSLDEAQRRTRDAVATSVRGAPQLTIFDVVHASVHEGGLVTLTGKVTQPSKRDAIRRTVEGIDGVREVEDLIAVLPASKSDDELRDRIARAIYGHARFWGYAMMTSPPIRIIVEGGHVTLTGTVRSQADAALARTLAMQSGARSVTSELKTR